MYKYTADSPEKAKEKVEKYAGRLNGGDFKWEFDDSKDDKSDDINQELKNALENYESDLISVGGNSIDMPEEPTPEEIKVESVALNLQSEELEVGETVTLTSTITPNDAINQNVTWSSDNTDVATVNNGVVTAVGEGTANITVTTQDGNKTAICEIKVIKEIGEITSMISYDNTELTNRTVTATIIFNKNDVTIINNEGSNQYVFEKNGEFTFEYVDSEGNTGTNTAKVNWIDKEAPTIEVKYEKINNEKEVLVTIKANEKLLEVEGWTLSEDRQSISKIFDENRIESVELSDLVGNVTETTIHVDTIENKPVNENQTQNNVNTNTTIKNPNDNIDNTNANKILPATGVKSIIKIFIAMTLVGMIVFYIRYKKLKDIVK